MKCDAVKFAGMYEEIYRDLYRFALCMLRNPQDAEDVVSEAVIRGYERVHSLKKEEAFKGWMLPYFLGCGKRSLPLLQKSEQRMKRNFSRGWRARVEKTV